MRFYIVLLVPFFFLLTFVLSQRAPKVWTLTVPATLNESAIFSQQISFPLTSPSNFVSLELAFRTASIPLRLCLKRTLPVLSEPTYWRPSTCTLFVHLPRRTTTLEIPFTGPTANYTLGLWYDEPPRNLTREPVSVTLTFSGNGCSSASDIPPDCFPVFEITDTPLPPIRTEFFFYLYKDVPPLTSQFVLQLLDSSANTSTIVNASIYAAFGATPSRGSAQSGVGTINIQFPATGRWYFLVSNPTTSTLNVLPTFIATTCSNFSLYGPNCNSPLHLIATDGEATDISILPFQQAFFYFRVSIDEPLYLTVANLPNGEIVPEVFLRIGNLPFPTSSPLNDVNGCTESTARCSLYSSVLFWPAGLSTHGDWFGVIVNNHSNTQSYALWLNSVCADNCSNIGRCDNETSICQCESPNNNLDILCRPPKVKIPVELLVFLIICCLVFLAFVMGLIAYLYMRKRRNQYERIS